VLGEDVELEAPEADEPEEEGEAQDEWDVSAALPFTDPPRRPSGTLLPTYPGHRLE
jgi:hypothetical protein